MKQEPSSSSDDEKPLASRKPGEFACSLQACTTPPGKPYGRPCMGSSAGNTCTAQHHGAQSSLSGPSQPTKSTPCPPPPSSPHHLLPAPQPRHPRPPQQQQQQLPRPKSRRRRLTRTARRMCPSAKRSQVRGRRGWEEASGWARRAGRALQQPARPPRWLSNEPVVGSRPVVEVSAPSTLPSLLRSPPHTSSSSVPACSTLRPSSPTQHEAAQELCLHHSSAECPCRPSPPLHAPPPCLWCTLTPHPTPCSCPCQAPRAAAAPCTQAGCLCRRQ